MPFEGEEAAMDGLMTSIALLDLKPNRDKHGECVRVSASTNHVQTIEVHVLASSHSTAAFRDGEEALAGVGWL